MSILSLSLSLSLSLTVQALETELARLREMIANVLITAGLSLRALSQPSIAIVDGDDAIGLRLVQDEWSSSLVCHAPIFAC